MSSFALNKKELQNLLKNELLKKSVFLILANKQDKKEAVSVEQVIRAMQLENINENNWGVFGVSALTGEGVEAGFDWLINKITR